MRDNGKGSLRVLIVGAAGLLGRALMRRWAGRPGWEAFGADIQPAGPGSLKLDILDGADVRRVLEETSPEVVVLTACNPHVDGCESDPFGTRRLNVDATLETARLARAAKARFIFFSSDYVFDGRRGGYREEDEPRPLNEYGRQKLEVERELAAMGEGALVVRVAALFGWEPHPKNYVLQVLSRLEQGLKAQAAADQDYTATYVDSLAEALERLVQAKASGLFHLTGSQTLSRYDLARETAAAFGFDKGLVESARMADFDRPGRAARPPHSALDSSKADRLFGARVCGAREGLSHMRAAQTEWQETRRHG